MFISAVTYTYNRADILEALLESICSQTLPSSVFELMVVDNGSTDRTKSLVEAYSNGCSNVHYYFEEQMGSSSARNRGWHEARGEYVAFIDDDGKIPPGWLETAAGIIQARKPAVIGGPVLPYYAPRKPEWFKDEYATITRGERARQLGPEEYLSGSNLIIRREILEAVNGFDEHLGHHGTRIGYGEETDLQRRVRKKFPQASIDYEPALYNYHLFREEKFSLAWQVRAKFALVRYNYLALRDGEHQLEIRHLLGVIFMPLIIVYGMTLGVLLRDRRKYRFPQNYVFGKT